MKSIFIEAGINHFGNLKEANCILSYFLKSNISIRSEHLARIREGVRYKTVSFTNTLNFCKEYFPDVSFLLFFPSKHFLVCEIFN